jgi:hypothetical protein
LTVRRGLRVTIVYDRLCFLSGSVSTKATHVRKYVTRVAIKRHNTSKKHDSIHRDCDICWALFELVSSLETIVPFENKDVVVDLRRRRVSFPSDCLPLRRRNSLVRVRRIANIPLNEPDIDKFLRGTS